MKSKLHLGCGREILPDFWNVDFSPLSGVDQVVDLSKKPWPFSDNAFDEIIIKHVLEHLPDTVFVMDELWRISRPNGVVTIRIPYWNSQDFITDPTHIKAFNEHTFNFFDPRHPSCLERSYYAKARFVIDSKIYFFRVFGRYFSVRLKPIQWLMERTALFLNNIIQVMEFRLVAVKEKGEGQ